MNKLIAKTEQAVVMTLLIAMLVVVISGTIELLIVILQEMQKPPRYLLLDINEMLPVFGFFLMILIGLELISSIRLYLEEHVIHAELVVVVALIAVARKVIVLDYEKTEPLTVIAIAALALGLSVGYYLLKRAHATEKAKG